MPLSFTEKRALQKVVVTNLASLQTGSLSFADKRKYQKELQDAFAKLKEKLDIPADPTTEALKQLESIKQFLPDGEYQSIKDGLSGEEKDFFLQKIGEIAKTIETMPQTYGQDGKGDDAVAYLHYFKGGSDWYITEKDKEASQIQAFGYAILGGDKINAELGYINIIEITKAGVELDLYWTPKTLGQIKGVAPEQEKKTEVSVEQKMTDAVVGYGGSITEQAPEQVSFVINDKKALIVSKDGGFKIYYGDNGEIVSDSYANPEDVVKEVYDWSKSQNQKLTDLIAGKFNNEPPEAFLSVLKDIIAEINDIEPVKIPTIGYIEANKEKIGTIMESALSEVFGKMWASTSIFEKSGNKGNNSYSTYLPKFTSEMQKLELTIDAGNSDDKGTAFIGKFSDARVTIDFMQSKSQRGDFWIKGKIGSEEFEYGIGNEPDKRYQLAISKIKALAEKVAQK